MKAGRVKGDERMEITGSAIDIETPDGLADAYIARPAAGGPYPAVLLHMDGPGLRPQLEQMADRFASNGFVVLVPNAFYRTGRAPLVPLEDLRAPERTDTTMQKLKGLISAITPEVAAADAASWVAVLDSQGDVKDGPIGTVGYCMGGALAIRTAAAFPDRVKAVATVHGGNLATDTGTSPHLLLPKLNAELYIAHADNDSSAPPEQQHRLQEALDTAGLTYEMEMLADARHGFSMDDMPAFDEGAATRHWEKVPALLARVLSPPKASTG